MKTWIVLGLAAVLAGCNVNADRNWSHISTTYDMSSDSGGVKVHNRLVLSDYVMRSALGGNPVTAAYVTIRNEGSGPDRLVSASCTCATTASLHAMVMQAGDMVMAEPKDGFPVAPGQTLVFAPGGNHIMLSGLKTRPQAGGVEAVILHFEKAGDLKLLMPVSDTPQAGK